MAERDEILGEARALLDAGEAAAADGVLAAAANADPEDGEVLALLAEARLVLAPGNPMAHVLKSVAALKLGHARQATEAAEAALALDPRHVAALNQLALCRQAEGDRDGACDALRRAAEAAPERGDPWLALGNALRESGRAEDAAAAYRRGLAVEAASAALHSNLAVTLQQLADTDGARAHFEAAIAVAPDLVAAHHNLAMLDLLCGRFAAGFDRFEWRWRKSGAINRPRVFPQPAWDGSPLAGRKLLVWCEQGIGDEIMFASLFAELIAEGRLLIECESRLVPLFARSFPEAEVVARREPPAPVLLAGDIEAQCAAGGLCRWRRRDAAAFPAPSAFLRADTHATQAARERNGDGPTVGIAWRSKTPFWGGIKSAPLAHWRAILATPGIRWINLQYGDCDAELAALESETGVTVHVDGDVDQMADLDAFAAQVAALDLVITTSNTTAHMAGALGVPCRVMLPRVPDWRWQLTGERALWYPRMRLHRQAQIGDWGRPIAEVALALHQGTALPDPA